MLSFHTTPEEFKNATITGHFAFVFEENSVWEIPYINIVKSSFSKTFPNFFSCSAGVFKFLRFEERFREALFL